MDKIQKTLIKLGHRDLAQEYFEKVAEAYKYKGGFYYDGKGKSLGQKVWFHNGLSGPLKIHFTSDKVVRKITLHKHMGDVKGKNVSRDSDEKGNIGKKLNVVDKNYKDRGYFTQKGTTGGYQEPGKKSLNKAAGQKYKSHSLIDKHKGKVLDHNPVRSLYVILFSNQNNAKSFLDDAGKDKTIKVTTRKLKNAEPNKPFGPSGLRGYKGIWLIAKY